MVANVVTWSLLGVAWAHQPYLGGDWNNPESAFPVDDPAISIVVYREITCDAPELWLTFEATAGDDVWVQLGVPILDRLKDYRPSMVLLAPGLPSLAEGEVPFEVPSGLGGIRFDADATPTQFDEPFTGTSSWIWSEAWVTTPESGPAYLVAWDPSVRTGKLWLAMGVIEDFSNVDWSEAANWTEDVNTFHETGGDASTAVEETCDTEPAADPEDVPDSTSAPTEASGCRTSGTTPTTSGLALLGILAMRRRRAHRAPQ